MCVCVCVCVCVCDIITDLHDFHSLNIDYERKLHSFTITNLDIVSLKTFQNMLIMSLNNNST